VLFLDGLINTEILSLFLSDRPVKLTRGTGVYIPDRCSPNLLFAAVSRERTIEAVAFLPVGRYPIVVAVFRRMLADLPRWTATAPPGLPTIYTHRKRFLSQGGQPRVPSIPLPCTSRKIMHIKAPFPSGGSPSSRSCPYRYNKYAQPSGLSVPSLSAACPGRPAARPYYSVSRRQNKDYYY
jgi:hypothetical protein